MFPPAEDGRGSNGSFFKKQKNIAKILDYIKNMIYKYNMLLKLNSKNIY